MPALQLVALFCIMFLVLGIFNILMARRRQQQERARGIRLPWYKQVSVLTSIEYVLLALAFLLNVALQYHWLPATLTSFVIPTYIVLFLASGLLAGYIIFQGIDNTRRRRALTSSTTQTSISSRAASTTITSTERADMTRRKRERRHRATTARRRRAGKA
jgi:hypothetical protein